jgi:hypothetical protein
MRTRPLPWSGVTWSVSGSELILSSAAERLP